MFFLTFIRICRIFRRPVFDVKRNSSCASFVKEAYVQKYLENVRKNVENSPHGDTNDIPNSKLSEILKSRIEALENIESLKELEKEDTENKEWKETIREERQSYEEKLNRIDSELISALVPKYPECNAVEFGISAGVGGQEAMLFAKDLFDMYLNYFNYKSWESFVAELDLSDQGGLRHACVLIEGREVMTHLRFECGVHRVQRVPSTEKSGRIHTSTVTVSVIPQAPEIVAQILPKDLIIETKRSSGAGGQHVNTTDSCVRMTHVPSGLVVECQTERSQIKNRQIALQRLRNMLYQKQLQEQEKNIRESKKFQIGTSARSDKVRTYNYVQDRITDHRLHQTWHNLPQYLKGGESLDNTITRLIDFYEEENLQNFMLSLKSMA